MIVGILSLLGSLGMFLFGMKIMSESLQRLSGERLRATMRTVAGNRFAGGIYRLLRHVRDSVLLGHDRDDRELRQRPAPHAH